MLIIQNLLGNNINILFTHILFRDLQFMYLDINKIEENMRKETYS